MLLQNVCSVRWEGCLAVTTEHVITFLNNIRAVEPTATGAYKTWLLKYDLNRHDAAAKEMRKASVYLSLETYQEIREDAQRHGRSISQSFCVAWKLVYDLIAKYPDGIK